MVMRSIDPRHLAFAFVALAALVVVPESISRWEDLLDQVSGTAQEEVTPSDLLAMRQSYETLQSEAAALRETRARLLAGRSDEPKAVMDLVLAQIRSNRLQLVAYDPGNAPQGRKEGRLKVEVEGKFERLRRFLFELERSPLGMAVHKAEIAAQQQSSQLLLKCEAEVASDK
jgi:hypothetical protein